MQNQPGPPLSSQAHFPPQDLPQHQAIPSHAELDMREVMHADGGPNYQTVMRETDIHMGPDSENIPSERCGGKGEPI